MMAGSANTSASVPDYEFSPIGGRITIPPDFKYAEVYRRGRPKHGTAGDLSTYDSFYIKHPPMECSRRAKLFAPFDALAGFSQFISSKQVLYEERRELTEGEREVLDARTAVLFQMASNSRMARENRVSASITYFVPCHDVHSEAYSTDGRMGTYKTVEGIVVKMDAVRREITLDVAAVTGKEAVTNDVISIPVDDIVDIHSEVFQESLESA